MISYVAEWINLFPVSTVVLLLLIVVILHLVFPGFLILGSAIMSSFSFFKDRFPGELGLAGSSSLVFVGHMPFLSSYQWCQSTKGNLKQCPNQGKTPAGFILSWFTGHCLITEGKKGHCFPYTSSSEVKYMHYAKRLECAQTWITQFYLQITPCLPLLPSRRQYPNY